MKELSILTPDTPKKRRKSKIDLKYLTEELNNKIVKMFDPNGNPKEVNIKASDFINAIKVIADLNGLKVLPDSTFKGEQDIDLD